MGGLKWTRSEEKYLKENYPLQKAEKVAEELDRSVNAVHLKANKLGIKSDHTSGKRWTSEEVEFLKNNYKKKLIKKLADDLNRSYKAIQAKAEGLDLTGNKECEIEEETIKDLYKEKKISPRKIAEKFDCSKNAVRRKLGQLDIEMRDLSEAVSIVVKQNKEKYLENIKLAQDKARKVNILDIDLSLDPGMGYILSVVDGDGWCQEGGIGMEIHPFDRKFISKFAKKLEKRGFNPSIKQRRYRKQLRLVASSKQFSDFYRSFDREEKLEFLLDDHKNAINYLEGTFESEGCTSYDVTIACTQRERSEMLHTLLNEFGISNYISPGFGLRIRRESIDRLLRLIDPIIERKRKFWRKGYPQELKPSSYLWRK